LYAVLQGHTQLVPFSLGRKTDSETLLEKAFGRVADLFRAYRLMRSSRPDVIHLNSAFDPRSIGRDALFVTMAKRLGIPVLILFHGSDNRCFAKLPPPIDWAKWLLLSRVTCVGVLSDVERSVFARAFPRVEDRLRVVKNVVDRSFLECAPDPDPEPRILFISRFIRAKGPFDLLRAIPRVLAATPRARFIFAGDGEDLAEFRRQAEIAGVLGAIQLLNNVSNLETVELYRRAWMLVFPSYYPEGMPMVVAEAMGCALPVVSTRTRFAESYLAQGKHLLYVPRGDPEAIARSVLMLIQDAELRHRMGVANRTLAGTLFSEDVVGGEFLNIYSELAGRERRGVDRSSRSSINALSGAVDT
jgi:glycosyltransferase involved in cell wall biosynthesis